MSILDLGDTTVDVKLYAGDIARLVGGEECDSFGDLVRIPHPAQRNCFPEPVFHLGERLPLLQTFHYGRIDMTGTDRIHSNPALAELVGPGARERAHGGLCGAVHAHAWKSLDRSDRRSQDDRSSIVHEWKPLLYGEEKSLHVRIEVKVEEFFVDGSKGRQLSNPGVRENDIELSTIPFDCFVQTVNVGQVGDVARNSRRLLADFGDRRLQRVLASAGNEDSVHTVS